MINHSVTQFSKVYLTIQGLIQVGDDVADIFDTDRQADYVRSGTGGDLSGLVLLAVGGESAVYLPNSYRLKSFAV